MVTALLKKNVTFRYLATGRSSLICHFHTIVDNTKNMWHVWCNAQKRLKHLTKLSLSTTPTYWIQPNNEVEIRHVSISDWLPNVERPDRVIVCSLEKTKEKNLRSWVDANAYPSCLRYAQKLKIVWEPAAKEGVGFYSSLFECIV